MATEYGEEEILDESYNDELPPSPAIKDQSYTTTSGEPVPVVKDEDIDEPKEGIEAESAEMLGKSSLPPPISQAEDLTGKQRATRKTSSSRPTSCPATGCAIPDRADRTTGSRISMRGCRARMSRGRVV